MKPGTKKVARTSWRSRRTRYDTYQSASVQVFLSEMANGEVQRLFERRRLIGPDGANAIQAYLEELSGVRQRGYAVNDGRTSLEEVGIAAPVHDHRGLLVAAIMLSAPRFRVPQAMLDQFGSAVAETARRVSLRLGGAAAVDHVVS